MLFVSFGVSVLIFLMIRLIPGDAAQVMLGASDTAPEHLAALRHQLGLDLPLITQYAHWIGGALRGDFGTSVWTGAPVIEEIAGRAGVTMELTVAALVVAVIVAVPAGCAMAALHRSGADLALRILSIAGVTIPSFWLGSMLLLGAAHLAPGIPLVGWVSFAAAPLVNLQHLVLPVTALALPVVATLARVLRASMIEALDQDFVRTARAKGLAERWVVLRHALRNALIPFTTSLGITAGYLFGGSVVIEQVFALPGLGRLMVGAIVERNYPLIQAAILLAAITFVVINFIVDIIYMAIDPRGAGMRGNKLLLIGLVLVLLQIGAAAFAPLLAGHDPNAQDILSRFQAPSRAFPLGTDNFGRDTFARALYGYRTLLFISATSVGFALCCGGTIGVFAAWRSGWFDRIAMRLMDVLFAFPIILLAIGVIAILGPGALGAAIAIGVVYTPIFARTLRAPTLLLRELDFIAAARAVGASETRLLLRHLVPNLAPVILVQASLSLSTAILVEASLSFLGLGTQPPTASLGRMLAESRSFLTNSPWPAVVSGAGILLAALGFNLLGDGLQDGLDPRFRSRR